MRAVDSVNLRVGPGEICDFLGLNGAGKTTTIRALLGMIRPSAGSVKVLGQAVGPNGRGPWQRVGHLVERPAAYPELSVWEKVYTATLWYFWLSSPGLGRPSPGGGPQIKRGSHCWFRLALSGAKVGYNERGLLGSDARRSYYREGTSHPPATTAIGRPSQPGPKTSPHAAGRGRVETPKGRKGGYEKNDQHA